MRKPWKQSRLVPRGSPYMEARQSSRSSFLRVLEASYINAAAVDYLRRILSSRLNAPESRTVSGGFSEKESRVSRPTWIEAFL